MWPSYWNWDPPLVFLVVMFYIDDSPHVKADVWTPQESLFRRRAKPIPRGCVIASTCFSPSLFLLSPRFRKQLIIKLCTSIWDAIFAPPAMEFSSTLPRATPFSDPTGVRIGFGAGSGSSRASPVRRASRIVATISVNGSEVDPVSSVNPVYKPTPKDRELRTPHSGYVALCLSVWSPLHAREVFELMPQSMKE